MYVFTLAVMCAVVSRSLVPIAHAHCTMHDKIDAVACYMMPLWWFAIGGLVAWVGGVVASAITGLVAGSDDLSLNSGQSLNLAIQPYVLLSVWLKTAMYDGNYIIAHCAMCDRVSRSRETTVHMYIWHSHTGFTVFTLKTFMGG